MLASQENSCYENTYWRFALEIAQQWRVRRGLARDPRWAMVTSTLCYPQLREWRGVRGKVYFYDDGSRALLSKRGITLGQVYACSLIPCTDYGIDGEAMLRTLRESLSEMRDERQGTGFVSDDFSYAMTAARLGAPELAIELMLNRSQGSTYQPQNGYWNSGRILPLLTSANGQLLMAVALMAGGWEGDGNRSAPGFPADGRWKVRAEGFQKLF